MSEAYDDAAERSAIWRSAQEDLLNEMMADLILYGHDEYSDWRERTEIWVNEFAQERSITIEQVKQND